MAELETKKRKNRNVDKSSYGKFKTVEDLEEHRVKASKPVRQIPREHIVSQNNWLTSDR